VTAIVAAGVIATVALGLFVRSGPRGTLAIDSLPAPVASEAELAQSDDAVVFQPADLEPLPTTKVIGGPSPVLPNTSATAILVATNTDLYLIDLVDGSSRSFRLPDALITDGPVSMFLVGDTVIISGYDVVILLSGDDLRSTRIASPHYALQTIADSSVWLLATGQSNSTRTALRVDLDGKIRDRVVVPAVIEPTAGTADLLVASTPGGLNLLTGDGVNSQTLSGRMIAVGDGRLARVECTADPTCHVVVGTFENPDQVWAQFATNEVPGSAGSLAGQFSPNGRWLALPLYPVDARGAHGLVTISIIDTVNGVEVGREESNSTRSFFVGHMAWTPDSRWLVLSTNNGLKAWHAGQRRTVILDVNIPDVGGVVVR